MVWPASCGVGVGVTCVAAVVAAGVTLAGVAGAGVVIRVVAAGVTLVICVGAGLITAATVGVTRCGADCVACATTVPLGVAWRPITAVGAGVRVGTGVGVAG